MRLKEYSSTITRMQARRDNINQQLLSGSKVDTYDAAKIHLSVCVYACRPVCVFLHACRCAGVCVCVFDGHLAVSGSRPPPLHLITCLSRGTNYLEEGMTPAAALSQVSPTVLPLLCRSHPVKIVHSSPSELPCEDSTQLS